MTYLNTYPSLGSSHVQARREGGAGGTLPQGLRV